MRYQIGQVWVGERETRVIIALPLTVVLFHRISTADVRRAITNYNTYASYGPAFCGKRAFGKWRSEDKAELKEEL